MNYLLQISVGPVQDFISAARRTRDLWFGSNMLSEISKAAAKSVSQNGGSLIFPAPENDDDLLPGSDLSVANIILAEFEDSDGEKLKAVSDFALEAAKSRLKIYAQKVYEKMKNYIVKDRWDSQLDDVIEFYSAWTPIDDGDYHSARKNVARLLAARKNIRDFKPNPFPDRVPKSSLDGLRESVLIRNESDEALSDLPKGVRIKPNESLDAIGLIKRVPTSKNDWVFPSVSSVALGILTREDENDFDDICGELEAPYIAFICADGDKMGAALSKLDSAESHRKFSRSLSRFALKARDVITMNQGICVYTGGDDVMAFVPVGDSLDCARGLYDLFKNTMRDYPDVSLSVGIAIAHAMENLAYLFSFGREAESIAKKGVRNKAVTDGNDRNGLAISVRSRGNIPFVVREQWKPLNDSEVLADMSIEQRIKFFAECFVNIKIPAKFPYELRENAKFYDSWTNASTISEAIRSDVIRIFSRKDITLDAGESKAVREYIISKVKDAETMREFADELILSQWISSGMTKGGDNIEVQNQTS